MSSELGQSRLNPEFQEWERWSEEWLSRHNMKATVEENPYRLDIDGSVEIICIQAASDEPILSAVYVPFDISVTDEPIGPSLSSGSKKVEIKSFGQLMRRQIKIRPAQVMVAITKTFETMSIEDQAAALAFAEVEVDSLASGRATFNKSNFVDRYYKWRQSPLDLTNLDETTPSSS